LHFLHHSYKKLDESKLWFNQEVGGYNVKDLSEVPQLCFFVLKSLIINQKQKL